VAPALWLARAFHLFAAVGFFLFAKAVDAGPWALAGVGLAWALLLAQHLILGNGRLDRINAAFFTANGLLSLSMLALFLLDIMGRP
jgi:4-hydroxybenzoate polyprenyltransferase